jgi:hypothetical protein
MQYQGYREGRVDLPQSSLVANLSLIALLLPGFFGEAVGGCEIRTLLSPDDLIIFKRNGGWCWYQDERVIVVEEKLIIGSVAATTRDGSRTGDVQVTTYDMNTGESTLYTLAPEFQPDDHDAPAFLELPDGRILASYMTHGEDQTEAETNLMRWRITEYPGNTSTWAPEQAADVGGWISYSNLFLLKGEGNRIYNFHRSHRGQPVGTNPNYMVSADAGKTFHYGGRLLLWPRPARNDPKYTGIGGGRPYVKYASNNFDAIHFVTTEDHPISYDNSIYHGFIKAGHVYQSDGGLIGPLGITDSMGISPTDLTLVFAGDLNNVAWTIDLHLDKDDRPYCAFSVQKNSARGRGELGAPEDGQDHRYYYARWDGKRWHVYEMAYGGTRLYPGEDDYTGLVALHPHDPETVFISTNSNPKTGEPLISEADQKRHREIFRGVTSDGGKTWTWIPITVDSKVDNLRPVVPIWKPGHTALLWLRGRFGTFTDYDLDIVGLVEP